MRALKARLIGIRQLTQHLTEPSAETFDVVRYCFDTEPAADFDELCKRMAGKALQSPYRSTVPLLSLVEHSRPDRQSLLTIGNPC